MLTENNFKDALKVMGFTEKNGGLYEKNFENVNAVMRADFNIKELFYPKNLKVNRDSIKNFSQNENFVVFECIHRLLNKGYKPEDIELEKPYPIGHLPKSGRADICVSHNQKTLFIIECKTFGAEFEKELKNLKADGGQLFSYWQQEETCQWLMLYASTLDDELKFSAKSIFCDEDTYKNSKNVPDKFATWSKIQKPLFDDVIFHDDTVAYKIGVKPLRKKNLTDFPNTSIVNIYEEILRHNSVTNKQNAFDALLELFICKLADESQKNLDDEVEFQFKFGSDNFEIFIDKLQKLYHQGMEEFMRINTTYSPLSVVENLLKQNQGESRKILENLFKEEFNKLKFYTPSIFNFIKVLNRKIFYKNSKIVREVVEEFKNYKIIGAKNLQTLGDLFEQLLDKGFKQDEGQFFTPLPITRFIWDSLPLDKIISAEKNFNTPKIIDYACGAGHFLTQGFEAINDFFAQKNISPPVHWEAEKLFGVEKNDRLSTVSKVSLFMHGAYKGKIKWGDGLENYSSEGFTPNTFDILVSNPPYAIKNFSQFLDIENKFVTLDKISNVGKEIETLFVERIFQLLKPGGIAAVILPSSILNKDGGSFTSAREIILKNFYVRAIVEFGSKTFSSTGTKTNILFLERISDPPQKFELYADTVNAIFSQNFSTEWNDEEIFSAWLAKIKVADAVYKKFVTRAVDYTDWQNAPYFGEYVSAFKDMPPKTISDDEKISWLNKRFYDFAQKIEREKIQYFAQTYTQTTLIISAPDDNKEQENFLGYSWSNRKGDEGIKIKSPGGLLYDTNNRRADNKLAAAVRKSFFGEQIQIPSAQNYFYYLNLADMIDFSGVNFTKSFKLTKETEIDYSGKYPLEKLGSIGKVAMCKRIMKYETSEEGEIPFYKIGTFGKKADAYITREKFEEYKKNYPYPKKGEVLISAAGTIGKTLIFDGEPAYFQDSNIVWISHDESIVTNLFLNIFYQTNPFHVTEGSVIKRLYNAGIENTEIPVPPIDEQKKIVEEFRAVDEEIAAQEKIIAACDVEVKEKFSEMFSGLKNFERLDKIAEVIQGTSPKSEFYNENGEGLPFYQGKKDFGEIYLNASNIWTKNFIKTAIQNDILMSVRAPVGDVNKNPFEKICIGRGLAAIRCSEKFLQDFVFYFLRFNKEKISGHTGTTFDSISGDEIKKILIPIPPKELQEEFAGYVRESENKKTAAQVRLEELKAARESLIEKYFR